MTNFETFKRPRPARSQVEKPPCPSVELHTAGQPRGYVAWDAWAAQMSETHEQRKCPGCGRWEIWIPREVA